MIKPKYVPILKWKKGEQESLENLDISIKDSIIPLIEIQTGINIDKFETQLECWLNRHYYFDVSSEYLEEDNTIYFTLLKKTNPNYVIPIALLDDIDVIENILKYSNNGIALRLSDSDFKDLDVFEEKLEEINKLINISNTDLIIDMKSIEPDNIDTKKYVAKSIINSIPKVDKYRNIILASASFPKTLSNISKNKIILLERLEYEFWFDCYNYLVKKGIYIIYSDYCINDPAYFDFAPYMKPSFNIRYTLEKEYLVIKGNTVESGGLNIANVKELCSLLVNSPYFMGSDFSYGDNYIYLRTLDGNNGPGNLTNWRTVGTNHHITYIINQLSNFDDTL